MSSASRTALFGKIHKVLKKYYKPAAPPADRTVLEHLLFACVLENARYEQAEEAFAALKHTFYDWNEVRVTSISELSEVMSTLPDPRAAANRAKRVLHAIFEELYCFDLEDRRKKSLGPTVKWLEKMDGASRFVVSYVTQAALDGHSVPVDSGTMSVFRVLDLATEKEATAGEVPGIERAIAKNKGVEFGSLIHQLGADYLANPFAAQVREIILAIDPDAAQRFPQRRQPRPEVPAAQPAPAAETSAAAGRKKKSEPVATKSDGKADVKADAKAAATKTAAAKSADGKTEAKAAESKKPASKKAEAARGAAQEKVAEKHHKAEKPHRAEKPSKPEKPAKGEKTEKHGHHAKPPAEMGKRKPR
jgi:endonuclease-3